MTDEAATMRAVADRAAAETLARVAEADLIEALAERQWRRMTRSSVAYADLPDGDKRACRVLVAPVLADVRDLEAS